MDSVTLTGPDLAGILETLVHNGLFGGNDDVFSAIATLAFSPAHLHLMIAPQDDEGQGRHRA